MGSKCVWRETGLKVIFFGSIHSKNLFFYYFGMVNGKICSPRVRGNSAQSVHIDFSNSLLFMSPFGSATHNFWPFLLIVRNSI